MKTMRVKQGAPQQKVVDHSTRAHALLSASGASRWINCTPSARLEDAEGKRQDTVFTREGTLAHEVAELFVRHDVTKDINDTEFSDRFSELQKDELYKDEMIGHAETYADYFRQAYGEAVKRSEHTFIEVEQRLDLTEYVPDSFGTADGVIISNGLLEVIDYKYGLGVKVDPNWNPQGMLYALGALAKYDLVFDITEVAFTIVQPRLDHIASFHLSVEELKKWGEDVVKPAAAKAFAGDGELKTGAWCKFCQVKAKCRAQFNENMTTAKRDFTDPLLLEDKDIVDVLKNADKVEAWLKSVREYATQSAVAGKEWPGYKLVRAKTLRKWADEDTAARAILSEFPEISEDQIYTMKLKGISDITKLVGKANASKLDGVIIKPEGAPTLVTIDDPRPAISGVADAVRDFGE